MGEKSVCGIDLGTTNSVITMWRNGKVQVLLNKRNESTMPSCVAFLEDGSLIGSSALAQQHVNPLNTIIEAKRIIGRKLGQLQNVLNYLPFAVIADEFERPYFDLPNISAEKIYAEQISAMILKQLKEEAECYFEQEVRIICIFFNMEKIAKLF